MYAKNKKGQMHFTKIYGIDLLLNFEGNMSHRPLFLTMILYTIQNVISLNCLFNYIFFYKTVFCVPENQERNVGLLKQVFPC